MGAGTLAPLHLRDPAAPGDADRELVAPDPLESAGGGSAKEHVMRPEPLAGLVRTIIARAPIGLMVEDPGDQVPAECAGQDGDGPDRAVPFQDTGPDEQD